MYKRDMKKFIDTEKKLLRIASFAKKKRLEMAGLLADQLILKP